MTLTRDTMTKRVNQARNGALKDNAEVLQALIDGDDPYIGGVQVTASAAEVNTIADVSARVQSLTASGAVTPGVQMVELSHATVVIAATIADAAAHAGTLFTVKNTSASGTAAHTVTLTAGTWDGTNTVITLNAPGECYQCVFDSAGDGLVVLNTGSVALS
jgi:molybdopterin/thiamine biosynthesis adenylyltransferase